jgi:hypothetical protein
MPVLSVVLFLLAILAGSLPAFSDEKVCCYPATFSPSPPYASNGCICAFVYDPTFTSLYFAFDPSDIYWNADLRFCSEVMASQGQDCGNVSFTCNVSPQGDYDYLISCSSSSSSGNNPFPSSFSCSPFPCYLDYSIFPDFGSGSGSGSACQSVYGLIDTFKGVKEGFLKVFIGSSFAFGLLGGAYAVLRVVF